jgi:hypothetical protein
VCTAPPALLRPATSADEYWYLKLRAIDSPAGRQGIVWGNDGHDAPVVAWSDPGGHPVRAGLGDHESVTVGDARRVDATVTGAS